MGLRLSAPEAVAVLVGVAHNFSVVQESQEGIVKRRCHHNRPLGGWNG